MAANETHSMFDPLPMASAILGLAVRSS